MEIRYQDKEESARQQRQAFLKLTPSERFAAFLALSRKMLKFPTKAASEDPDSNTHFVLKKKNEE